MLEYITDNISAKVLSSFEKVVPLAEIVKSGDKSFPAEYVSDGNYTPIDPDNMAGVGYFRLNGKPQIKNADTKMPQRDIMEYSYPLRFVGCIKKSILGKDDAFVGNALCTILSKQLEENNTSLRSTLGANKASIKVKTFDFDHISVLSDEYKGVSITKGIPLDFCLLSIDMDITVTIKNSCIATICDTYCGGVTPILINSSSSLVRGGNIKFVYPVVVCSDNVYSYYIPELVGKTKAKIQFVQLDELQLVPAQYDLLNGMFTITDTLKDITSDTYLNIGYITI